MSYRPGATARAVLGAAFLLSLGPYLAVDGHLTHIPLPDLIFTKLPELSSIVPVRMSFEVDACIAVLIAFGLDDLRRLRNPAWSRSPASWNMAGITCLLVTMVIVVTQFPQWPYASSQHPTLQAQVRRLIPPGDPVTITYPYSGPFNSQALVWQAQDSFAFKLAWGVRTTPESDGHRLNMAEPPNPPRLATIPHGRGVALRPLREPTADQLPACHHRPQNLGQLRRKDGAYRPFRHPLRRRHCPLHRALGPPQRSLGNLVAWTSRKGAL